MAFEGMSWMKRSRFLGAMRYHRVWLGRLIGWVLLVLLLGNAAMLAISLAGVGDLRMDGVSADFGTAMAFLLICACLASHSRTRFLMRFGTARFPVWLSNVTALFAGMAVYLIASLLINLAVGGAVTALSGVMPGRFAMASYRSGLPEGAALLWRSLGDSLAQLPRQLLWLLEWTCLFYLLGCCLRRSRGVTLAVIIGVPFVFFMLMLVPAVNETIAALESASEGQLMVMGLQWMQWLAKAVRFVAEQWQWIQLGAAVISLPLSYLCMRGTPQP